MKLRDRILEKIDFAKFYTKYFPDFPTGKTQVDVNCIFHNDENPSLSINLQDGTFHCKSPACSANIGGGIFDFYALKHACSIGQAFIELAKEVGVDIEGNVIEDYIVKKHQKMLQNTPVKLAWLKEECGWETVTIEKFQIGYDGERYTIPIFDDEGICRNIRRYLPGAGNNKMLSYKQGYGKARLFPIVNVDADTVLILEGEKDTILANQVGYDCSVSEGKTIGAITGTTGAGSWNTDWNLLLKGKQVLICYDIDAAGKKGAGIVAYSLNKVASEVKIIELPLTEPADADFTDYIVKHGFEKADFDKLIENAPVYSPPVIIEKDETVYDVSLDKASNAEFYHKRVKMRVVVAGKDLAPYLVPKKIKIFCPHTGTTKKCKGCELTESGGEKEVEFDIESAEILKLIDCSDAMQNKVIRSHIGIISDCAKFQAEVSEAMNIEEVRLIPELDTHNGDHEYVMRVAYKVGGSVRANASYEVRGVTVPNPKTQYATHILTDMQNAQDSIESFQMTEGLGKKLEIFRPQSGQGLLSKLDEIYKDFEDNIVRIKERRDMFLAFDLTAHSLLDFNFLDQYVRKGRVEGLILGDTRQGKSEVAMGLVKHYQLGEVIKGENVTFAGLVGGLYHALKRWYVNWGRIPINDRRWLIIDEASGLKDFEIENLSGIRSDGIAELIKIQTERTNARTRLTWISNARSKLPLNTYSQGILAVQELIGRPEDIARFDFALTVASDEVDEKLMNTRPPKVKAPHRFTSQLCKQLLLWVWSRKTDDVIFEDLAVDTILEMSSALGKKYSASIPLVEPAEQRIKIAKIAASLAARTFSTTDDYQKVYVENEHVIYAVKFLEDAYDKPSMAYDLYSLSVRREMNIGSEEKIIKEFENLFPIGSLSNWEMLLDTVSFIMDSQYLSISDLMDVTGEDREHVKALVSELVRQRCIKKHYTAYRKTPAFIRWLRKYHGELLKKVNDMKGDD